MPAWTLALRDRADFVARGQSLCARQSSAPTTDATAANPRRLKLLFLHPKTLVDSWPFTVDTLGEIVKAPSAVYPVLAAMISTLPVDMEMFDGYVTRESFANYKRRLTRADVIAISVMSPLKALDTEVTIRIAKALNPAVKIILGGNHASAFPDRWIQCGADFVVVGEGELAFRALMEQLVAGESVFTSIPNLVYRDQDEIKSTGVKAPSVELDDMPLPRWDLLDLSRYHLGMAKDGVVATVEVSRGCPHRCDFCNINTFWNYRQRYKSVERVCAELEQLQALGVREIIFADDNFAQDHRHTRRLFEEMIRRKIDIRFGSFIRGDTVHRHPDLIELAAKAGFSFCLMGIETLDPKWLKSHRKGVRAEDAATMYAAVYDTLRRNGVFVIGLFITPAEAPAGRVSGRGADGLVCDAHFTADLLATKGSALYDDLLRRNAVGKDMFYHDWNLASISFGNGSVQVSRKTFFMNLKAWNGFAVRTAFFGRSLARRFRWRLLGVVLERLACSSWSDIVRYRIAKDTALSLADRQRLIVESVTSPQAFARLVRARRVKSPLSLRNGLWSVQPLGDSAGWMRVRRNMAGKSQDAFQ
jgi:anaerobic magnesium-protoporphyrin IX monomethyl ester cyclase